MNRHYNEAMLLVRYAYVLALTVWVGGMVALGTVAAPATFSVLSARDPSTGRVLAGAVFGEILRRFYLVGDVAAIVLIVCLVAMALVGPRPAALGLRIALISIMLALNLYAQFPVRRQIGRLQKEIDGPVAALPDTDPRRAAFGRLHGISTALMLINAVGGLVLLVWETRE